MKRIGFIYEKICNIDNIKTAILKAAKGKTNRHEVQQILNDIDNKSIEIQEILLNNNYTPSEYKIFTVKDGMNKKERTIHCPKFYPDQVIHWCLMLQIQPIIMKGMYDLSCGSIPNRGLHYGKKFIEKWITQDTKHTKYCLKMDIRKFFPSINQYTLSKLFETKIKDIKTLDLIDKIIFSIDKGLPIGNYTSQWFANFYLEKLDHYIKENLKVKYYVRYIDDIVIFGNNKKVLHNVRKSIEDFLFNFSLELKNDWQVFKVDLRDINFLGFRFFRNKTILRKKLMKRIVRKSQNTSRYKTKHNIQGMLSYYGWLKYSNSHNLYNNKIKPNISIKECKLLLN